MVINVWGSWCAPCRVETPDLVRLANETADQGVQFVGINTRDNRAAAKAFVRSFGVPYPSLQDPDGQVLLDFQGVVPTSVVPSTVVIDRQVQPRRRTNQRRTWLNRTCIRYARTCPLLISFSSARCTGRPSVMPRRNGI